MQIFNEKLKGNNIDENNNFFEASKNLSIEELNKVIKYLGDNDLKIQEENQLLKNYDEYYDIFERDFDKALAYSIFEYHLTNIYSLDRKDYEQFKKDKDKCPNLSEQNSFSRNIN